MQLWCSGQYYKGGNSYRLVRTVSQYSSTCATDWEAIRKIATNKPHSPKAHLRPCPDYVALLQISYAEGLTVYSLTALLTVSAVRCRVAFSLKRVSSPHTRRRNKLLLGNKWQQCRGKQVPSCVCCPAPHRSGTHREIRTALQVQRWPRRWWKLI